MALTNWPASTTASLLIPFDVFMFAFDVTESGTRYGDLMRWSHPAVPGSVPSSWDSTDATKQAGRRSLADTSGGIIAAHAMGNTLWAYKAQGAYAIQYTGGTSIFRSRLEFAQLGVAGPKCVCDFGEAGSGHLVLTPDFNLVQHTLNSASSILTRRWREWLRTNINAEYVGQSFLVNVASKDEVWAFLPTGGATAPNIVLVWNYVENTITLREAEGAVCGAIGACSDSTGEAFWDDDEEVWDSDGEIWDAGVHTVKQQRLLMGCPGASPLLKVANVTNALNGANMSSYVERTGLAIVGRDRQGNPKVDWSTRKFIRRARIRMESTGPVQIRLTAQEQKGGIVYYSEPAFFDPTTMTFVDLTIAGVGVGIRVESDSNISWSLSGYDLDIELLGAA